MVPLKFVVKDFVMSVIGVILYIVPGMRSRIARPRLNKTPKLLCLCIAGIGDAVMTIPALDLLRKAYPKALIDVMVVDGKSTSDLFQTFPKINRIIEYQKKQSPIELLSFLYTLRKARYDVTLGFYPSQFIGAVLSFLIGADIRIGHTYRMGYLVNTASFLLNRPIPLKQKHQSDLNSEILRELQIHIPIHLPDPHLNVKPANQEEADALLGQHSLEGKKFAVLHPGGLTSVYKHWPIEYYNSLCDMIIEKMELDVVLLVSEGEKASTKSMRSMSKHADRIHLICTKLQVSMGILMRADFLVANDSGLAHCSAALGKKTYTLFGYTNVSYCRPRGKQSYCITPLHYKPAYDIYRIESVTDPGKYMRSITPESVFKTITEKNTPS